jgi:LPS export ABC transporter permease LptF
MKIIHRYILREFAESFIFGLLVFSGILLLDQIFQLINLVLGKGVSIWIVFRLFMLILPNIFSVAIPMAVLFGILLSYGRLSEDNEIIVLRSTGLNYFTFTWPVIALVFLLSAGLVLFNQEISPLTHRQFRAIYQDILRQRPLIKFENKTITSLNEYRIFVTEVDKKTNTLYGVNIYKFDPKEAGIPWRISASSATVTLSSKSVVFHLFTGYWQKPTPKELRDLVHLNFLKYQFSIPINDSMMPQSQSLKEMSGRDISREIKKYRDKNMPTNFLENEYWLRWTLAFAPFALCMIGIPLGMIVERGAKSVGFGMSLLVLFGYYMLLVTGINMGEKGYMPAGVVMWLPNLITLLLGLLLWRKMLKK